MRLLTYVGFVAHAVDRGAAYLLWFVPFRVPVALLLAALLAFGAWQSLASAQALEASLPSPAPSSVRAIVGGERPAWIRFDALVSGPFYDSRSYAPEAPIVRYYYVLRDPSDPRLALVARSERLPEQLRRRTIVARVESNPAAVAAALDRLPEPSVEVDPERHLVELPADGATDPPGATPSRLGDAEVVRLTGDFVSSACVSGACPPDAFAYLVTDADAGVVVASPHGPDALPVTVTGIVTTDRFRMTQVLGDTPLAAALAGTEHPTTQLLVEGAAPMLPEVSYVTAVMLGVGAAVLLASRVIGYPIFRRRALKRPVRAAVLAAGEELPLEISGQMPSPHGSVRMDREAGYLSRMPSSEAIRKEWQYWGQPLTELAPALQAALHDRGVHDPGRLMLHSGAESALVALEPPPDGLRLAAGELLTVGGARPAVQLRTGEMNAILSFGSAAQRERALAELDPSAERLPAPAAAPEGGVAALPETGPSTSAPPAEWRLLVCIVFFVLIGIVVAGAGLAGLATLVSGTPGDPIGTAISTLLLVGIGLFLVIIAVGLRNRREWAHVFALNAAGAGVLVALVLAVAQGFCLRPIGPTLQACQPGELLAAGVALAAVAGFGFTLWTILGLRDLFTR